MATLACRTVTARREPLVPFGDGRGGGLVKAPGHVVDPDVELDDDAVPYQSSRPVSHYAGSPPYRSHWVNLVGPGPSLRCLDLSSQEVPQLHIRTFHMVYEPVL